MAAGRTAAWRDGTRFRLSLLFLGAAALAGCGPRPAPPVSAPPPVPLPPLRTEPGLVTLPAYLPLHPAATELRRLDAAINRLSRPESVPPPPAAPAPPVPQAVETPVAPDLGAPPSLRANSVRAADAVAEDYALRKRARPDTAGEQYQRELARLERQYLEQRQQPRDAELADTLVESRRYAEESARLGAELRRLRERPGDRLLYGAAKLEQRRREYRQIEVRLEAMRRAEIARLGVLLEPEPSRTLRIPAELVKAAEQRRDEARAQADAALQREEAAVVDAVRSTQLPPPAEELPPAPEAPSVEPVPPPLLRRPRTPPSSAPNSTRSAGTVRALREARTALLREMLADLRMAALTAGREAGVDVVFNPGQAPDKTAALASRVRRLVQWGRTGGPG